MRRIQSLETHSHPRHLRLVNGAGTRFASHQLCHDGLISDLLAPLPSAWRRPQRRIFAQHLVARVKKMAPSPAPLVALSVYSVAIRCISKWRYQRRLGRPTVIVSKFNNVCHRERGSRVRVTSSSPSCSGVVYTSWSSARVRAVRPSRAEVRKLS